MSTLPGGSGALWGGAGIGSGSGGGAVGVAFSEIAMAAYRIAGITKWARIGPSQDMYDECIPAYNRMVGSWNCERPKCFTIRVDTLPIPTQKACTVGVGADFDMPRPQGIQNGVVVLEGGTRCAPMAQLTDEQWAHIRVQDIPASIPQSFYFDGSYDDQGWSRIYLFPQASGGLQVDWYTWQALPSVTSKDDQVALPPGYEEAITYNLAVRLASLNPLIGNMSEDSRRLARKALAVLEAHNSAPPTMTSDYPRGKGGSRFNWWSGEVR